MYSLNTPKTQTEFNFEIVSYLWSKPSDFCVEIRHYRDGLNSWLKRRSKTRLRRKCRSKTRRCRFSKRCVRVGLFYRSRKILFLPNRFHRWTFRQPTPRFRNSQSCRRREQMLSRQLVKSSCCLKMVQNSSLALVYVEHYAFIHFLSLYFNSGIGILFNLCLKIYISKFFFLNCSQWNHQQHAAVFAFVPWALQ